MVRGLRTYDFGRHAAQVGILIVFSQLGLGGDYFRQPISTVVLAVAVVLWTASFGLLIGVVAKSQE